MTGKELAVNDAVEVVNGLWKGTKGFVEDIHRESSVIRIRDLSGDTAYALKTDVKPIKAPKTD
jgi:ribosomal protein L24